MNLVTAARTIAMEAHGATVNRHDGELYLLHVNRVVIASVDRIGGSGVMVEAVAWLHDVVEDTDYTTVSLWTELNCRSDADPELIRLVVDGVDGMTKRQGESLEDYYQRCKANIFSRHVKLHGDLPDNFRRNHLIEDDATRLRMAAKYSLGMDILS